MRSDLRFALRQLVHAPGFAAVVVIILALGIGAAVAMFTVVSSVLLRPVDYPDSEDLVVVRETKLPQFPQFSVSPANYLDFAKEIPAFASAYATSGATFNFTGGPEPVRVSAQRATGRYFEVLRVPPMLGRVFGPAEDSPGKGNVVVLLHSFWQRQFGGRADIIGQQLMFNGTAYTVLGVMPPNFRRGSNTDVLVPMAFAADEAARRGAHYLNMVARLAPGATITDARTQLTTLAAHLSTQFPDSNKGWGIKIVSILENNTGGVRPTLYALLAAVGLLLLIACANVANLLLARATVRTRELSIRAALGAGRWQIVRLLLGESLLLALIGGAAGILLAHWGLDALLALAPDAIPRAAEIALDTHALFAAVGISLLTGLLFGLVPALQFSRPHLHAVLGDGARGASESGRRHWLRGALVVAEIALALMLLTGAGLLMQSFSRLRQASPGFVSSGVVTAAIALPDGAYDTPEKQGAFVESVLARHAALPGVRSVGVTHVMPFTGSDWVLSLEVDGRPVAQSDLPSVNYFSVSPGYFATLGIPLQRGRTFTAQDRLGNTPVAIVSQSFASVYFPNGDALGKRISVTNGPQQWREIVGIVGDVKHASLDSPTQPQMYDSVFQHPFQRLSFALRADTTEAAAALSTALRREIYSVDPAQPVFGIVTLDQLVADSMSRGRFALTLFAVFSGVAVTLAALGIYSVMAYGVTQRHREFGIRLALGAAPDDILGLVLRRGSQLVFLGIVLGLLGALATARLISSLLYATTPTDPLVFTLVALAMSATALLACYLPARRATRVDPMIALRAE